MIHYTKFSSDEDFADWQFKNNFNIIAIAPVALNALTVPENTDQERPQNGRLMMEYGVMVTWSENKSLERSQILAIMLMFERMETDAAEGKSLDEILSTAAPYYRTMLAQYKKRNGIKSIRTGEKESPVGEGDKDGAV